MHSTEAPSPTSRYVTFLSAFFLFTSGAASLIYQVVWVRLLSLSIGSTSASVSMVLATFFLGLSLGSYLTSKIKRSHSNIRLYLLVEIIIGVSALALLPLLLNLDSLVSTWPILAEYFGFKLLLVVLLLIIPCLGIGATYPIVANLIINKKEHIGSKLGWLYSMNTFGAVFGVLAVAFLLIPLWGLDGAIYIAFTLNLSIVILGWIFRSQFTTANTPVETTNHNQPDIEKRDKIFLYALLFISGFVALSNEVAWTKYVSILTHTTIYGFSAILAVFLTGIAIGAWLIKHFADRLKHPYIMLVGLFIALSASLILARIGLDQLPGFYQTLETEYANDFSKFALIFFILSPATILMGALFTLNIKLLCVNPNNIHDHVGKAYAINTFGGILGSLIAGLWLIPIYGSNSVLVLTTLLTIAAAATLLFSISNSRIRFIFSIFALSLLIGNWFLPKLNFQNIVQSSSYYFDLETQTDKQPDFLFVKEGRSSVVSVSTYDNKLFRIQSNSLAEASLSPDNIFAWRAETFLGLLPTLLHSQPKNALQVGFGGGTTLAALIKSDIESVDIVELEPQILEANSVLFPNGFEALKDPRVTLEINDARHVLLTRQNHYDLIISQPSHPWLAGNASLFSLEYFKLMKSRLNQGGIVTQWVNLFNMDADRLKSIMKAFYLNFPHGMSFIVKNEYSMILIGSIEPIVLDFVHINERINSPEIKPIVSKWKISHPYDLLPYFAFSRNEIMQASAQARPNTDLNLLTEIHLPHLRQFTKNEQSPYSLFRTHYGLDIVDFLNPQHKQERLADIAKYFYYHKDKMRYQRIKKLELEASQSPPP